MARLRVLGLQLVAIFVATCAFECRPVPPSTTKSRLQPLVKPHADALQHVVLPVGQGSCELYVCPTGESERGARIVITGCGSSARIQRTPLAEALGGAFEAVDAVLAIVSHVDADHVNLLEALVGALKPPVLGEPPVLGVTSKLAIIADRYHALSRSKKTLDNTLLSVFGSPDGPKDPKGVHVLEKPCTSHKDCLPEPVADAVKKWCQVPGVSVELVWANNAATEGDVKTAASEGRGMPLSAGTCKDTNRNGIVTRVSVAPVGAEAWGPAAVRKAVAGSAVAGPAAAAGAGEPGPTVHSHPHGHSHIHFGDFDLGCKKGADAYKGLLSAWLKSPSRSSAKCGLRPCAAAPMFARGFPGAGASAAAGAGAGAAADPIIPLISATARTTARALACPRHCGCHSPMSFTLPLLTALTIRWRCSSPLRTRWTATGTGIRAAPPSQCSSTPRASLPPAAAAAQRWEAAPVQGPAQEAGGAQR